MLGDNIILMRKRQGMSQQALADEMHVVRQTISKWEKNLSVPDAEALVRLADALDTTVQELLGAAEEASAAPGDVAAALTQINAQLAIQNRRRGLIWKTVAWVLGILVGLNLLLITLSWTAMVEYAAEGDAIEVMEWSEQVALPMSGN